MARKPVRRSSARKPATKPATKRKPTVSGQSVPAAISSVTGDDTVRIRQIENGYIVSKETFSKRGGYQTKESFVAKKPKISVT